VLEVDGQHAFLFPLVLPGEEHREIANQNEKGRRQQKDEKVQIVDFGRVLAGLNRHHPFP
jgi:hypothetical protein